MIRQITYGLLVMSVVGSPAHAGKDPCKGVKMDGLARTLTVGDLTWRKTMNTGIHDQLEFEVGLTNAGEPMLCPHGYGGVCSLGDKADLRRKALDEAPVFPEGSAITVTFSDGSTMGLTSRVSVTASLYVKDLVIYLRYETPFQLTTDQWDQLSSQPIVTVSFDSDGETKVEVSERHGAKFSEAASCLSE